MTDLGSPPPRVRGKLLENNELFESFPYNLAQSCESLYNCEDGFTHSTTFYMVVKCCGSMYEATKTFTTVYNYVYTYKLMDNCSESCIHFYNVVLPCKTLYNHLQGYTTMLRLYNVIISKKKKGEIWMSSSTKNIILILHFIAHSCHMIFLLKNSYPQQIKKRVIDFV